MANRNHTLKMIQASPDSASARSIWLDDGDVIKPVVTTPSGGCQINDDCQGDLVCDGNLKKCRKESTDLGQYDGSFCSAGGRLCQEGEGDCDGDNECAGSLKCGVDNCNRPEQNTWPSHYDCCYALVPEGGVCQINDDCPCNLVCDGNLKKCRKESTDLGQYDPTTAGTTTTTPEYKGKHLMI